MILTDKSVLITGGSRGLGRSLAIELSRRGAQVVITGRNEKTLQAVEAEIQAQGHRCIALVSDISQKEAIYPLTAQIAQFYGPIDILINNASTLGPTPLRPFAETDCEDLELALATNLVGPFRLIKAVLGSMIVRQTGCIVNISSDASQVPYPEWGAYSVTKAALDHLTRIWASELSYSNIKFVCIDPGEMNTQMHADAIPNADKNALASPDDVARTLANIIEQSGRIKTGNRIVVNHEWRREYETSQLA